MQNWDRNIQDIKFKQKLNNVKSTLPKISYASNSNNYPSINKKKNISNNSQNYNNLEILYINSNRLPNSQNNILNINHQQNKKEMKNQNYLKHLLNEFGLSQYLRKMYELGYDDKNVNKIGQLSRTAFQDLLQNIHIFPGQAVKMEKLYDYLKQLNLTKNLTIPAYLNNINKTSSNNNTLPKKPVSGNINKRKVNNNTICNFNSNLNYLCDNNNFKPNGNMHKTFGSPNHYNNKCIFEIERPKTSIIKAKSKSKSIFNIDNKSYVNYRGEINNSYLNIKNNGRNEYSYNNKNFNYNNKANNNFKTELLEKKNKILNCNKKRDFEPNYFIGKENNKVCCPNIDKNMCCEQYEEKVTKNIDKMIKYYMVQLNEKLDKSYESIEDSSLSYNVILPLNDKNTSNIHENQINLDDNKENKLPNINNIKLENKKEKEKEHNTINKNPRPKSKYENNIILNCQKSSEKKEKIQNKNANEKENEKAIKNYNDSDNKSKEITKNEKNKEIGNIVNENKEVDVNSILEEEQNQQQVIEEIIEESKSNNNITYNNRINIIEKIDPNNTIEDNDNNIYSTDQNLYENLRLNKSFEKDYLNQNTEQFDIEYMCKCLGLALIKYLEQGKGKSHITDLIKNKDKFIFFNSTYNKNFEILSNFFNSENNKEIDMLSNLEKLNLILKNDDDNQEINILKHISKPNDKNLIEEEGKTEKLKFKAGLNEIEKDIKFIDEFFSVGKNRVVRNYNGLSEKTKNIMSKNLSYINEVDSEVSTTKNKNISNTNINTSNQEEFKIPEENLEQEEDTVNTVDINDKKELENNSNNFIKEKKENIINEEILKNNKTKKVDENNKNNEQNISMESDYIIDINTIDQFKIYLLKQMEIFDDDFIYSAMHIPTRKYVPPPDPQCIFEFCANIMILTKMEKEIIIIALIYIERLIFNTGLLLTNRNWRRLIFTVMVVASKIWDDDSFENNHFGQVFTHLSIGEINLLERTFLELIDYKVYVKCSEYLKYFFIIKSIALKYNYNGAELVPIPVERMMKIQEYAFQMQKKTKKKKSLNNSAHF